MISSHVKITCYVRSLLLRLHTKSSVPFAVKSEMVWYFIGVYIINRTFRHSHLKIRSSFVENYFTSELRSTFEEKFRISARPCDILYVCNLLNWLRGSGKSLTWTHFDRSISTLLYQGLPR